jgi:hypothetical protein
VPVLVHLDVAHPQAEAHLVALHDGPDDPGCESAEGSGEKVAVMSVLEPHASAARLRVTPQPFTGMSRLSNSSRVWNIL